MLRIQIDFNRSPILSDSIVYTVYGLLGMGEKIVKYLSENWMMDSDYRISVEIQGADFTHTMSARLNALDPDQIDLLLANCLYHNSKALRYFTVQDPNEPSEDEEDTTHLEDYKKHMEEILENWVPENLPDVDITVHEEGSVDPRKENEDTQ